MIEVGQILTAREEILDDLGLVSFTMPDESYIIVTPPLIRIKSRNKKGGYRIIGLRSDGEQYEIPAIFSEEFLLEKFENPNG